MSASSVCGGWVVVAPDGELTHHQDVPTQEALRRHVSDGGPFDLIQLPKASVAGWIHGDAFPAGLERNPVGGCLLAAMSGQVCMTAGPIGITGWDRVREIRALTVGELGAVMELYQEVRIALSGKPVGAPGWAGRMRALGLVLRTGPAPVLQVAG